MSTTSQPKPLSLSGKLGAQITVLKALLLSYMGVLTYPITSSSTKQPTIQQERTRRIFRALLSGLSPMQLQWVNPPGTQTYKNWLSANAQAEGVPAEPLTEELLDGGRLHWIGKKTATKVILHFHSGGYALPLIPAHIDFINFLRKEVQRRSIVDVKIAFLEYTLIPHGAYPTQFRQAVSALQTVISGGISPSDILLSGDSAGGQLALQTASHVLHPHPSVPELSLSSPLSGILLIGPWTLFSVETSTWKTNLHADVLNAASISFWANSVRQSPLLDAKANYAEAGGHWLEPTLAPSSWWAGMERVTKHILFCWGEREVLKDGIVQCIKKMKEGVDNTVVKIEEAEERRGLHIGPVLDAGNGRKPGEASEIMAGWASQRLA